MIDKNTRICNASVFVGKKQALKDWLMANVFTVDAKWVSQKEFFEALAGTAFKDLVTTALMNDAISELQSEGLIILNTDGFPADPA